VGATIVDLAFQRSPGLGQVVRVRVGEGSAALHAALERYAFKFEVSSPTCGAHEDMAGDC
jgi:hypothetical protein